jgi:hypothetical protein
MKKEKHFTFEIPILCCLKGTPALFSTISRCNENEKHAKISNMKIQVFACVITPITHITNSPGHCALLTSG